MNNQIIITDQQNALDIDHDKLLTTIDFVLGHFNIDRGTVNLAVVGDDDIRQLEKQYFDQDMITDVLSFDIRDDEAGSIDCEIVVNAQRAIDEAGKRSSDPVAELHLYVVHGLLHQLGYDDLTDDEYENMHAKEDQILSELGFGKVFDNK
ncbi:MAG: rRNA maturation RNase YbeY [Phycisphaerae bacterium]|nr:rRNA maturation RNase YbeY [Phycisphaerae bacterium]